MDLDSNHGALMKRKAQDGEEGEVIPLKGAKQPKNVKNKWAPSLESREETGAEARRGSRTWAPR